MLRECGRGEMGSPLLIAESSDNATDCIVMNAATAIIMVFMMAIRTIPLVFVIRRLQKVAQLSISVRNPQYLMYKIDSMQRKTVVGRP
jgi:hypothetical protein